MTRLAVIADDITGANTTGVLPPQKGMEGGGAVGPPASLDRLSSWDGIVWNANSRLLPAGEAGKRVRGMAGRLRDLPSARPCNWPSGSTAPCGAPSAPKPKRCCRLAPGMRWRPGAPAFPASGRITRGKTLFVHGVPVHQTEVGRNLYSPVRTSDASELIRSRDLSAGGMGGNGKAPHLAEALSKAVAQGAKSWLRRRVGTGH